MRDALWWREVLAAGLVLVCAGLARAQGEETRVSGQMSSADGRPLPGVILLEEGRLYGKNFRHGGRIGADGRYSVRVPNGGGYGLHLYATGHVYFPLAIEVKTGQDNRFEFALPPNAASADAPAITDVRFDVDPEDPDQVVIRLTVEDPNDNLSHQVLAANTATQEGYRMKPDKLVFPWTKNYPDGVYALTYDTGGWPLDREEWVFVAADNRCYTSDVLGYPFTAEGVIRGGPSEPGGPAADAVEAEVDLDPEQFLARGREVYANNCRICHYPDSTKTKVGPGLRGLFQRKLTPARKVPVTEESIRAQIQDGSENMPPYAHVRGADQTALIVYLKTL